jgi:hypothetical protein
MATKSNLFDLPSVLSIAKAGLGVAAQYSAYASEKYNTQLRTQQLNKSTGLSMLRLHSKITGIINTNLTLGTGPLTT